MMRHRPPRMILRSRLRIPDIAGISSKLPAFKSANHCITIADQTPRCVHEVSAALHFADQRIVEQVERPGMEWRVDRYHVADLDHVFYARMIGQAKPLPHILREPVLIEIMQLHVEG